MLILLMKYLNHKASRLNHRRRHILRHHQRHLQPPKCQQLMAANLACLMQ
jgi:hypothetical protein